MRPTELGEIFTTEWTHEAIAEVVNKGMCHLTQVCTIQYHGTFYLIPFIISESPSLGPAA